MEAKDFQLPIEGSLSKLALLHTQQQEEQPRSLLSETKAENKTAKSLQKNKKSVLKKKK